MNSNDMTIADLTDMIMDEVGPMFIGLDTGMIISALVNVTTHVTMAGLSYDQRTALRVIAAACENASANLESPPH